MTNEELLNQTKKKIYERLGGDNLPCGYYGYDEKEFEQGVISAIEVVENEIKERLIKGIEISKEHIKKSLSLLDPSIVEASKDYMDGLMDGVDEVSGAIGQMNISDEIRRLK